MMHARGEDGILNRAPFVPKRPALIEVLKKWKQRS